jgi:hypothetical protein
MSFFKNKFYKHFIFKYIYIYMYKLKEKSLEIIPLRFIQKKKKKIKQ